MIREFAGAGQQFGLRIDYSRDWPKLRGTGGAIHEALPLLGDRFFVLYGDSYLSTDYLAIERAFLDCGRPALMTVFRNEGRWDASNIEFAEGRILAYDKKVRSPGMRHIDYGLGAFKSRVFEPLGKGSFDLADIYRGLLQEDELAAFEVADRFYEIGSMEGIRDLEGFLECEGRSA
jgi:NDP-sugar pyrophosphorylase family protein